MYSRKCINAIQNLESRVLDHILIFHLVSYVLGFTVCQCKGSHPITSRNGQIVWFSLVTEAKGFLKFAVNGNLQGSAIVHNLLQTY